MLNLYTPAQTELREAAAAAAVHIVGPTLKEDDERETFRKAYFVALAENGLCGVPIPESYGGLGMGYVEYCAVLEAIAQTSAAYAVTVAVNGLPQMILMNHGQPAQRERYLPQLTGGACLGAFALSEPNSGSDAAALKTTARRVEGGYVLQGTKLWITHGGVADLYVVMARTDSHKTRGITAFLVDSDSPGLSVGKKEEKMGLRASPTTELVLEEVFVPTAQRLGQEGEGFSIALSALDSGRITIGATAIGLCRAALAVASRYATERTAFEQPIIDFQGVGFMLADMAMATEAAALMVHRAASLRDAGAPYSAVAAMAKCLATDAAMKVSTDAVQVLGGMGYTREFPVERYLRDAKVMQIVEGTNQIQRLVISREIKKRYTTG